MDIEEDQDEHQAMIDGIPIKCVIMIKDGIPGI